MFRTLMTTNRPTLRRLQQTALGSIVAFSSILAGGCPTSDPEMLLEPMEGLDLTGRTTEVAAASSTCRPMPGSNKRQLISRRLLDRHHPRNRNTAIPRTARRISRAAMEAF